uniref:Uncharacterized protein n=1 Tax=Meloidogyne enterolobii TaxID=390850 RepID=A0A6V7VPM2_MELEN|nr:unnamed protein product [Meloidogyne enterolobii]
MDRGQSINQFINFGRWLLSKIVDRSTLMDWTNTCLDILQLKRLMMKTTKSSSNIQT